MDGNDGNKAFDLVSLRQEELQNLLDDGGEADDAPERSLADIKNAGQLLLDAINALSLADFEEEYSEDGDGDGEEDANVLDAIFVGQP